MNYPNPILMVLFLISLAVLVFAIKRNREIFLRPSILFSMVYLIRVGGAAAFGNLDDLRSGLDVLVFRLLAVGFPIPIILWAVFTPKLTKACYQIWSNCRNAHKVKHLQVEKVVGIFLGSVVLMVLVALVNKVSFTQLGIYAVVMDPENANLYRENTWKTLDSKFLKSSLGFYSQIAIPMLVSLVYFGRLSVNKSTKDLFLRLVLFVLLVVVSSPNGARGPVAWCFLIWGVSYLIHKGWARGVAPVTVGMVMVPVTVTILSLLRIGELGTASMSRTFDVFSAASGRLFYTPFFTGYMTNEFAYASGYFGFDCIGFPGKIRFGFNHVELPILAGYFNNPNETYTYWMNTGGLFVFQSAFGLLMGWTIAVIALCSLDSIIHLFRKFNGPILVSLLISFIMAIADLVESDFSTVMFGNILRLALVMGLIRIIFGCQIDKRQKKLHSMEISTPVNRSYS